MNYTEEDVRNAFNAGLTKGNHKSYFDAPLDEDEYLTELKQGKNNIVLADVIKSVCDVCGSDDIIEAPHMGKNCNRCHPL